MSQLDLSLVRAALADWRQGDCVLGDEWFVHRLVPELPLTEVGAVAAAAGAALAQEDVVGLVVLTQTCDLVRDPSTRPYIEVSPLVHVEDPLLLRQIKKGDRPRYAHLPGVEGRSLVADLDRVMTVEKAALVGWPRTPGCRTDAEVRAFSAALARKRSRVAFPDDFVALARRLVGRLAEKHDKQSPEGEALRALAQIRVRARPSWDADRVTLELLFVVDAEEDMLAMEEHRERWLALVPAGGRFDRIDGRPTSLEELSAMEYLESDPLDLDHLSGDLGA